MKSLQLKATLKSDISVLMIAVLLSGTRVITAAVVKCHVGHP